MRKGRKEARIGPFKKDSVMGSGCGTGVSRAVASVTKGHEFESSHQRLVYLLLIVEKTKIKKLANKRTYSLENKTSIHSNFLNGILGRFFFIYSILSSVKENTTSVLNSPITGFELDDLVWEATALPNEPQSYSSNLNFHKT